MEGFMKFFGTGGARFVVSTQIRATAGLWLHYGTTNLYIDPGPGALVKVRKSKFTVDPTQLDGIVLTHKHLDHANDANVMIEAMTEGGFKKRGVLYCPEEALGSDPIILQHTRRYPERVEFLTENGTYRIKDVTFSTPIRHRHPVETYGLFFHLPRTVALIADTRYFDALPDHYRADVVIANVLRTKPIEDHDPVEHMALDDFVRIISAIKPEVAVMTHFGLKMIQENPRTIAQQVREETGINVIAAFDGMTLNL
jgi:phosphoribosyl 1,2-cyclic phosphodiesterase